MVAPQQFCWLFCWQLLAALVLAHPAHAQLWNLPPRSAAAPNGTQFTNIITALSRDEREQWVYAQIISGNVPNWLRTLKPITVSSPGHTATYHVTPDYVAIGSDTDFFRMPMTPLLAQRLADRFGFSLPTRRMVNQIWTNAAVKLPPSTIPADPNMITVPYFAQHNAAVASQRNATTNAQPLGVLVGGTKKDVIITARIYTNFAQASITKPVVIYGWHYTDGAFIQPVYNGHEETYADYSHGIRFAQQQLLVDGNPNTVSNLLTSATLCALLSDDGLPEGSTNGTIPVPRYTVSPLAPTVMTHPRGRSLAPGTNWSLSALAIGDAPLLYQWRVNGINLPSATNAALALSNFHSGLAGNYSVVVSNIVGMSTSRVAVIRSTATDFPILAQDDFETNAASRWAVYSGAANGVPDYRVDFAFDYGVVPYTFNGVTALIPPAPNSPEGGTRGVRLAVNTDAVATNAAVNLYLKDFSVAGNFALKFDLWINYPGNAGGTGAGVAGSTQHAQFGINHAGTNVNWSTTAAPLSDGLWFAVDGEGGTSADYRAFVGNPSGAPIEITSNVMTASNNAAASYQSLFPATRFETAGAPGKNWVEVEVRQTNNVVAWLMDGSLIGLRTNTTLFTNGTILLGLMDVFPSIAVPARDSFVLFDNVRIENLAPPIHFTHIARTANGSIEIAIVSARGDTFQIETSADLTNWSPIATLTMTNQPFTFLDPTAPSSHAYYRARRQ